METRVDRWVQRATVAGLLGLAALLLAVGVALYSPRHGAARAEAVVAR